MMARAGSRWIVFLSCRTSRPTPGLMWRNFRWRYPSAPALLSEGLQGRRDQRQNDNPYHYFFKIPAHDVDLTELIAKRHHEGDPEDSAAEAEEQETRISHAGHACDERGAGAHDGDKAGIDYGAPPVFVVELPRALNVIGTEEARFRAAEDARAGVVAEEISHVVAHDRRAHEQPGKEINVVARGPAGYADAEEQGIARKEKTHQQAGFSEDNGEQPQHSQRVRKQVANEFQKPLGVIERLQEVRDCVHQLFR